MFGRTAIYLVALAAPALLGQDELLSQDTPLGQEAPPSAADLFHSRGLAVLPYEKYYHSVNFTIKKKSVPKGCVVRVQMVPYVAFKSPGPQEYGMLMVLRSIALKSPGDPAEDKEREKANKKMEQEKKKEESELWQYYTMPAEKPYTWEFKFAPDGKVASNSPGTVKFYFPMTEFRYSGDMWEREIIVRTGLTYPMSRFDGIGRVDYAGNVTVLVDNKVVGREGFKTDIKGWFFPAMEYFGSLDIHFKNGKPKVALSPPGNFWSRSRKISPSMDRWEGLGDLLEKLKRGELADYYEESRELSL